MKRIIFTLSTFCFTLEFLQAQTEKDKAYIIERTNVKALEEFAKQKTTDFEQMQLLAIANNISFEIVNKKGQKGYLSGFTKDGKAIYDYDSNVDAAITSSVIDLWNNGASGLNLTGNNIQIGHWEAGGLALTTHIEFQGRVVHAENENVSSHATHTACTMIGAGFDNSARGMAVNATIVSRRSPNDEAEVANFAATGGLVSNHSYVTGNPNGAVFEYGQYNASSQEWDQLLYNAPFLSVCKSAGNDRNDNVNVGDFGYDLIYSFGVSKNVLTIGAVDDVLNYIGPQSVNQSSFTSYGPSDDWRIKPDITANGVTLFSADNVSNSAYTFKSGTSMSAPIVTGSITLLQEHYHNLNGVYMTAAMVKALLIATTDEAGLFDGPDFRSGWGLLNSSEAARVVSTNDSIDVMRQLSLNSGFLYSTTFEVDGTSPFTAAIAWTDPASNVLSIGEDDPTLMLVNDLDLRISKDGVTYEPWILTPTTNHNNFEDPATVGDNFRDNVERIDIDSLPAGEYSLFVSHKGNLVNGFQDFALILDGILKQGEPIGIKDLNDLRNPIQVFPIPSKDGLIQVLIPKEHHADNYQVEVFDLQGKLVLDKVYTNPEFTLDLSGFSSGLFMLHVKINEEQYKQLVVVE